MSANGEHQAAQAPRQQGPPPPAQQGAASNRDASRTAASGRPRVQQLRPTNKSVPAAAAASSATSVNLPDASLSAASGSGQQKSGGSAENGSSSNGAAVARPRVVPRIVTGQGSGSTILVNSCQKGNPILQQIKNIGWEYSDIVPDYQVGVSSCALFLSLRYHRVHPEYIHSRIQKLGNMYTLRLLLVHCDVDQPENAIKELTKVALINNLTLMVAWSDEELGAYLEKYKSFENKAPDLIRERVNDDYMSHLTSALTSIKGVNKTDVITLATNFGSLKRIAEANADDLSVCPGFGGVKTRRLLEALRQPFREGETRTGRERRAERERLYGRDTALEEAVREQRALEAERGPAALQESTTNGSTTSSNESALPRQPLSSRTSSNGPAATAATTASAVASDGAAAVLAQPPGADDEIEDPDDWMDGMTEEERLQLALEMSISGADAEANF